MICQILWLTLAVMHSLCICQNQKKISGFEFLQDMQLKDSARRVGGVPILSLKGKVPTLERPSERSKKIAGLKVGYFALDFLAHCFIPNSRVPW